MWEAEPVGVELKRPLVGFAVVAVLCAVLMALSMGQGWTLDLHPGKPITGSPVGAAAEPSAADAPLSSEPARISIPPELSAQPLGLESSATAADSRAAVREPRGGRPACGSDTAVRRVAGGAPEPRCARTYTGTSRFTPLSAPARR